MSDRLNAPNLSENETESISCQINSIVDITTRLRRLPLLFMFLISSLVVNETLEFAKHVQLQSSQSVQALCETLDRQKKTVDTILQDLLQHAQHAHDENEFDRALIESAIHKCVQLTVAVQKRRAEMLPPQNNEATE